MYPEKIRLVYVQYFRKILNFQLSGRFENNLSGKFSGKVKTFYVEIFEKQIC